MENTESDRPASTSTATPTSDETFLITWLFDRDAECPLCKYNLRGLTSPRCPECGEALQLGVSLVEPYLKAWIAVVAGLLLPAGVGVLFLVAVLREGWPPGAPFWGSVGLLYVICCIPLSIALLARRRYFLRLPRPTQQILAGVVWAALLIALAGVLSQMR
jgi:hypothetical protein